MEQDELLAKQLQMEEAQLQKFSGNNFESQITGSVHKVLKYEDAVCQAQALSVIPSDEILSDAQEMVQINDEFGGEADMKQEDYVAQALLKWFKTFFKWVDAPACDFCGGSTQGAGQSMPTMDEQQYEASRVELYQCKLCRNITRFPRFNDPGHLLTTRRGRCGEWANAFTLCCRAMDLKARFVLDWTDHVWTEYYSHSKQRWIHLDPCECVYDKPLLYEGGWGKQLSYVVGFSVYGAKDITKRYTGKWNQLAQGRNKVDEEWLRNRLAQVTFKFRANLDTDDIASAKQMDQHEEQELLQSQDRVTEEELPGRQTGSVEWRSQRGEVGKNKPAPKRAFTSYRFCKNEPTDDAQNSKIVRIKGGVARASGENAPNELAVNLFDGKNSSKWLDFGGGGVNGTAWVEYRLRESSNLMVVLNYSVVSANDSCERDPADWTLIAISIDDEGNEVETEVDRRSGVCFEKRHQSKNFEVQKERAAKRWKLCIHKSWQPKSANSIQLSCLHLFGKTASAQTSEIKNDKMTFEEVLRREFQKLVVQGKQPDQAGAEALAIALAHFKK